MITFYAVLLAASALLFLGTIGYLVANLGAVALVFGKRPREAAPGDLIADPRARKAEASPRAIKAALAIHVVGVIGLVLTGLAMANALLRNHPSADPLPPNMSPVEQSAPS